MATLGKVGEFQPALEDWPQYVERFKFFLTANDITSAEKKCATFLAVIGPSTYKLLRSMLAPRNPGEVSFDETIKVLSDHYSPKPSEIVSRFKFYNRSRQPGESVSTFVSEIRALARFCNFGESSLDSMIRDRLVCGIQDEQIQKHLLSKGDKLTLAKALTLSQAIETANKDVQLLLPQSVSIQSVQAKPQKKPCYHCLIPGHSPADRRFKSAKCHNCHKIGHLRKACTAPPTTKVVKQVLQDDVVINSHPTLLDSADSEYTLFKLSSSSSKPIEVSVMIDKQQLIMELDTGAAVSLVSEETYHRLWPQKQLQQAATVLRTYSGEQLHVCGCMEVEVVYGHQLFTLPLLVIKGNGPSLFGRDWLSQIRLNWREINMLQEETLQGILAQHKEVFQEGLGTLRGYTAKIHVDPSASPKFCKSRTIPYAFRLKVEDELDRLVKQGIIEPVQFADWAAPIVVVIKRVFAFAGTLN